jgi:hypothetical protein
MGLALALAVAVAVAVAVAAAAASSKPQAAGWRVAQRATPQRKRNERKRKRINHIPHFCRSPRCPLFAVVLISLPTRYAVISNFQTNEALAFN